jgi:hypothetical protein
MFTIICNTLPIKFTGWATSSMSWLTGNFTAQRPDVILPLFTRVSVLPTKFTPVDQQRKQQKLLR